jgi:hypothetical protein
MLANPHDFISFSYLEKQAAIPEMARLYKKGLSLRDISARLEIPKTVVRSELLRTGISLRASSKDLNSNPKRPKGKLATKPPYGFCYFEGEITKHPKEYPVLQSIHKQWKLGVNANSIAEKLNEKRIPSPMNKEWSWNSVKNIIDRFNAKKIIQSGDGKLELT